MDKKNTLLGYCMMVHHLPTESLMLEISIIKLLRTLLIDISYCRVTEFITFRDLIVTVPTLKESSPQTSHMTKSRV